MKRGWIWTELAAAFLLGGALAACAPASTPQERAAEKTPTPEAMMKKEGGDMMEKGTPTPDAMMMKKDDGSMMMEMPAQVVAPHFVDSTPAHGQVLKAVSSTIVINFNFNLHDNSTITVKKDGAMAAAEKATVDSNRLTLRAKLPGGLGDGVYTVTYKACWPDASCHDGQFSFQVDSKLAGYQDMTDKSEVAIVMQGLAFGPTKIIVSKGTKVTWTNKESVTHFVNTDPHPSHTHLPGLNSRDLAQGQNFTFTFTQTGEWPYHCSAHVPQGMVGSVVVV